VLLAVEELCHAPWGSSALEIGIAPSEHRLNQQSAGEALTMASATPTSIDERLRAWLETHGIAYQVHPHPAAYTAMGAALAEGVEPSTFTKVVGVRTDEGRVALVALDAVDKLDMRKVGALVGAGVRLLTELELRRACPDWEVGTVPPIAALAGVQVFADQGIRADEQVSFNAGSHQIAVRVDRAGWEAAAEITYGDLARTDAGR
jgi:Ala-tRNA(Pro) deacylase